MVHRGELLEKAAEETKTPKSKLARHLNISRNQLYNWFQDAELNLDIIIKAGKYMNYDFSVLIPDIKSFKSSADEEENLSYKVKYMELAEKMIQVMEEKELYRKKVDELQKIKKRKK